MLKSLKQFFKNIFTKPPAYKGRTCPNVKVGDKIGNVTILTQNQLDKHTDFKIGESYRLGEMIITLRSSKSEIAAIIAATDKRRQAKEDKLRERAIDIMMMTPKQLMEFKLNEFLASRIKRQGVLEAVMGRFSGKRYMKPTDTISGDPKDRFKDLIKKTKDKVH